MSDESTIAAAIRQSIHECRIVDVGDVPEDAIYSTPGYEDSVHHTDGELDAWGVTKDGDAWRLRCRPPQAGEHEEPGMKRERYNLHGDGDVLCEVYDVSAGVPQHERGWHLVTGVPCPVEGCGQTLVWYEAGYVPGYRVCMAPANDNAYDHATLRHRFHLRGPGWRLVRDKCCESDE